MRTAIVLGLLTILFATSALAQPAGDWDFDGMPPGPWGGTVLEGDGTKVQVVDVLGGTTGGAGLPPGATGNILQVDARNTNTRIVIRFNYNCAPGVPTGICQVSYGYSAAAWTSGSGFGVYVDDDGSYTNPDDLYEPPVGFPPSTTFGTNSENEPDCLANHTIDFVVQPGTILYLDDFGFECLLPIPTESKSWSAVKGLFR
jgi:hypothetical protein